MPKRTDGIINKVVDQIKKDVDDGDVTSIEELIRSIHRHGLLKELRAFMPEV